MGQSVSEWSDNNEQPVLTVPVKVVTKREEVSTSSFNHGNNTASSLSSSTSYFVTFEFASGDRKEFSLSASQYGLLAENDTGELTFQGTRYQGFSRQTAAPATEAAAQVADQPPLASEDGFCPYCGMPVRGDFKFCPQCSKPLPEYTAKT
jgi:predicted amidophosphoribosyltransferase